jgi:surface polysaccharide O-acyltransferase-like enzyme
MPTLARWYIKTSLLYLALGTLFGAVILWNKGAPIPGAWQTLAAHIALVTWGWLLLLTCGVAYWILPRWGQERRRVWLAAAAYFGLNIALWLVALAPWLPAAWPNAAGGALQAAACGAFALHAWPRVRKSAYGA